MKILVSSLLLFLSLLASDCSKSSVDYLVYSQDSKQLTNASFISKYLNRSICVSSFSIKDARINNDSLSVGLSKPQKCPLSHPVIRKKLFSASEIVEQIDYIPCDLSVNLVLDARYFDYLPSKVGSVFTFECVSNPSSVSYFKSCIIPGVVLPPKITLTQPQQLPQTHIKTEVAHSEPIYRDLPARVSSIVNFDTSKPASIYVSFTGHNSELKFNFPSSYLRSNNVFLGRNCTLSCEILNNRLVDCKIKSWN